MSTNHTLVNVPKGSAYSNISGEGTICVKARAITRNERGIIDSKRGVVFKANSLQEIPEFVLNVYKEWDGRGELQYFVFEDPIDLSLSTVGHTIRTLDQWTTIS